MGFKDTQWATTLTLPMKWKVVLLAVCIHTDDRSHITIAGQRTLADAIGASVDKVSEALGVLEDLGVISRNRRNGVGGYRTSDEITVNTTYSGETQQGNDPVGKPPTRKNPATYTEISPSPTPEFAGAEEINQLDQPEDQPDIRPSTEIDEFDDWLKQPVVANETQFPTFWDVWPKKVAKLDAAKAWAKAIKRAPTQTIYDAAKAYADNPHRPAKQFIPQASTWLNGDRWEDELPEAPEPERLRLTRTEENLAYVLSLAQNEVHQEEITS